MTSEQLQAIADRATGDSGALARWDVLRAMADRDALLRYVAELHERVSVQPLQARGTWDTLHLPTTGAPLVVKVLADKAAYRFTSTWSIWTPGEGWLKSKRGRRAWSTRAAAEAVLDA